MSTSLRSLSIQPYVELRESNSFVLRDEAVHEPIDHIAPERIWRAPPVISDASGRWRRSEASYLPHSCLWSAPRWRHCQATRRALCPCSTERYRRAKSHSADETMAKTPDRCSRSKSIIKSRAKYPNTPRRLWLTRGTQLYRAPNSPSTEEMSTSTKTF